MAVRDVGSLDATDETEAAEEQTDSKQPEASEKPNTSDNTKSVLPITDS